MAKIVLFADNTTLGVECSDLENLGTKVNFVLEMCSRWFCDNNLKVITRRSNDLFFKLKQSDTIKLGHRKKVNLGLIKLNSSIIPSVKYKRCLGLPLDYKLGWHKHLNFLKTIFSCLFPIEVPSKSLSNWHTKNSLLCVFL